MTKSADPADKQSYRQILKSTSVVGGASIINVAFSILRNKALATMLGPEGIGIIALYNSIVDMSQAIVGLGINASGVRQIAAAAAEDDTKRVSRVVTVLHVSSLILGSIGSSILMVFSSEIAQITFGDHQNTTGVMIVALAVGFQVLTGAHAAHLQGTRNIAALALMGILAGFFGLVIGVPLILLLGEHGIAPSLAGTALVNFLTAWWLGRRISVSRSSISITQALHESGDLIKLGLVFMASGFLTWGSAYAIRLIVASEGGLHAAGLYQAAWALGGLYASFILQAMGTDFYPRLTAISKDDDECNRLVNEQTEVSILLAGPGLISTLTLAPAVMALFYSTEFQGAVDILRWICLGMMLRIISWPIGFIVLAKGAKAVFFWSDVAAAAVHVGLAWLCVPVFGAAGAGFAFFGLYVWHTVLIYCVARRLTNFRWSPANWKLTSAYLPISVFVFCSFEFLPLWQATGLGLTIAAAVGLFSLKTLANLLPQEAFPRMIRPLLNMRRV